MSLFKGRRGGGGSELLHTVCSGVGCHSLLKPTNHITQAIAGDDVVSGGAGRGVTPRRSVDQHTSLGGVLSIDIYSSIIPPHRGPRRMTSVKCTVGLIADHVSCTVLVSP